MLSTVLSVKKLNKMYNDRNDSDDGSFKLDKLVLNNGAILKATVGTSFIEENKIIILS